MGFLLIQFTFILFSSWTLFENFHLLKIFFKRRDSGHITFGVQFFHSFPHNMKNIIKLSFYHRKTKPNKFLLMALSHSLRKNRKIKVGKKFLKLFFIFGVRDFLLSHFLRLLISILCVCIFNYRKNP
jgi:hypothetical protein